MLEIFVEVNVVSKRFGSVPAEHGFWSVMESLCCEIHYSTGMEGGKTTYKTGDVVWVKIRSCPWWPSQVLDMKEKYVGFQSSKTPIACVNFLAEDCIEVLTEQKKILPFQCELRQTLQDKGMKDQKYCKLFEKAVLEAKTILGIVDIDTHKEVMEKLCHEGPTCINSPAGDSSHNNPSELTLSATPNVSNRLSSTEHISQLSVGPSHGKSPKSLPDKSALGHGLPVDTCENRLTSPQPSIESQTRVVTSQKQHRKSNLVDKNLTSKPDGECNNENSGKRKKRKDSSDLPKKRSRTRSKPTPTVINKTGKERSPSNMLRRREVILVNSQSSSDDVNTVTSAGKISRLGALQKLKFVAEQKEEKKSLKRGLFDHANSEEEKNTTTEGDIANKVQDSKINRMKNPGKTRQKMSKVQRKARRLSLDDTFGSENDVGASQGTVEDTSIKPRMFKLPSESNLLLTPQLSLANGVTGTDDISSSACKTRSSMSHSSSLDFDPNLSKDMCNSDQDSEDDLPEGLTPVKPPESLPLEGDIVWAKFGGWSFWPAVVCKAYPINKKKKKPAHVSLLFINDGMLFDRPKKKTFSIKYVGQPKVLSFTDKRREEFEVQGSLSQDKLLIEEAVKQVDDYITKKGLGKIKGDALSYFFPNTEGELEEKSTGEDSGPESQRDRLWSVESDIEIHNISESLEEGEITSDICTTDFAKDNPLSNTMVNRNQKRKEKCEKIVEFIMSDQMKEYLTQIHEGKKPSDRHKIYHQGTVTERNKLRNSGFGPINDEEQRNDILDQLLIWLKDIVGPGLRGGIIDYTMDVWVPEAIVYALRKLKKYTCSKAWEMFHKGIRFTREEMDYAHHAMLESAKRISPADRELYAEKLKERLEREMLL